MSLIVGFDKKWCVKCVRCDEKTDKKIGQKKWFFSKWNMGTDFGWFPNKSSIKDNNKFEDFA